MVEAIEKEIKSIKQLVKIRKNIENSTRLMTIRAGILDSRIQERLDAIKEYDGYSINSIVEVIGRVKQAKHGVGVLNGKTGLFEPIIHSYWKVTHLDVLEDCPIRCVSLNPEKTYETMSFSKEEIKKIS